MTKEEFAGVWALLTTCRPQDKKLHSRETRRAWWLVLEPYNAADVKAAVLAFVRDSALSPFVSDITQRLSPPAPKEEPVEDDLTENEQPKGPAPWEAPYYTPQVVARMRKDMAEIDAFLAKHGEEY